MRHYICEVEIDVEGDVNHVPSKVVKRFEFTSQEEANRRFWEGLSNLGKQHTAQFAEDGSLFVEVVDVTTGSLLYSVMSMSEIMWLENVYKVEVSNEIQKQSS